MIKSICLSVVSIIAITCTAFADKKIPPTFAKAPDHEDFAKKLFSAALPGDENENFVISPYGAFQAFSLISLGAKGKTSQAFNITLGYDTNAPCPFISKICSECNESLASGNNEKVKLQLSNSIWLAPKFKPKPSFIKHADDGFNAVVKQVEMGLPAQQQINEYVALRTKGMIKELLKEPPDAATELITVNTVYLDAKWKNPFKKTSTFKRPFYAARGERQVDFMHSTSQYKIFKSDICKILFLPYYGEQLEMAIILPEKNTALNILKGKFTSDCLSRISKNAPFKTVEVALPKFEISYRIDLINPLSKMGLGIAFSYLADFSRISDTSLSISKAEQVAKIRVDEDGTEAAAATYIAMMRCALMRADEEFIAERPFIFVLRDKKTSAILFAGKLSCP